MNGAAANSPQSTAVQLYAVINAQSGVVKSQVRLTGLPFCFRIHPLVSFASC